MTTRVIVCIVLLLADVFAGDNTGRTGAFLRLGLGARSRGMGGTYTGIADNSTAAYYNPAGLAFLQTREVNLAYSLMSFDRLFHSAGFSRPLPPSAGFSIGILHGGFSESDARTSSGDAFDKIEDTKIAVMMGFALRVSERVAIGITPKWLHSKVFDVSASSVGLDVGAMVKLRDNLTVGLALKEIGQKFKYTRDPRGEGDETTTDRLPFTTRTGIAYRHEWNAATVKSLLLGVDFESVAGPSGRFHFGVESNFLDVFSIRLGLDDRDFTAGFSFPFKIHDYRLQVDYAFIHDSREGMETGSHDVGINFQF